MVALLPPGVLQFCDANGMPYAGGTLATYIPGTTTPKTTWQDAAGTAANTQPVILDSAGRCILYGDGLYRTILHDAAGNLIWDQPSSTLVSAAMAPVCIAIDLPTARAAMGITDAIAAEATARAAAVTAEATARAAADTAEATARAAADTVLTTALAAEVTRAKAAEAVLTAGAPIAVKSGSGGPTDGAGHFRINYPVAFPTVTTSFVVTTASAGLSQSAWSAAPDRFGADVWCVISPTYTGAAGIGFYWLATGS